MIILAAAIILSLNSSGIIGKANQAKEDSNMANKKQAASVLLAEYELKVQTGESVGGKDATTYVQEGLNSLGLDGSDVAVTPEGEILMGLKGTAISAAKKGVKIGDYVAYTPVSATSSIKTGNTITGTGGDYFATETDMTYRYAGIDDNGNVILISNKTTTGEYYGEGIYYTSSDIDDLCEELYSNSNLGIARSVKIEDVNRILGANPIGTYYSYLEDKDVENPKGLTVKEIMEQKGEPALDFTYNTFGVIDNLVSNYYEYDGVPFSEGNTIRQHELVFENVVTNADGITSKTDANYWLSSECINVLFGLEAQLKMRCIRNGMVDTVVQTTTEDPDGGFGNINGFALRPLIVLNEDVEFDQKIDGVWNFAE